MTWRKGRDKKNSKKTNKTKMLSFAVCKKNASWGYTKTGNVWISVLTVSESVYIVFCW